MKARQIIAYSVLPGLWPRLKELFGSGFSHLAFMIAAVYQNVGLLPQNHPYLNTQNFGRYGIRHVMAAASNNLVFSRQNIDKVVIYFMILLGLVILCVQLILFVLSLVAAPAFATTWTDMFLIAPADARQDIAFGVLDEVFGVMNFLGTEGFFGSCYSIPGEVCLNINDDPVPSPDTFPQPFHLALHSMLSFYSLGIAFVAGVVIIYLVVAVVGETAVSGTPFGKRFNKAWVVPRLIMFFALIAPMSLTGMNAGINAGQFITLGAAKFGSNLATNAWTGFSDSINDGYAYAEEAGTMYGRQKTLIAFPNVPSVAKLNQFMYIVRLCMYAEKVLNNADVRPYLVRETRRFDNIAMDPALDVRLYTSTSFEDAVEFSRYEKVIIRFGELNTPFDLLPGDYEKDLGYVKPLCGDLNFEIAAAPPSSGTDPVITGSVNGAKVTLGIQENYYLSIREYLLADPTYETTAFCMLKAILPYDHDPDCVNNTGTHNFNDLMWSTHGTPGSFPNIAYNTEWLTRELAKNSINYYDALNRYYLNGNFTVNGVAYTGENPYYTDSIIGLLRANYDFTIPDNVLKHGWVGMSMYYMQIAEVNGLISAAVQNVPNIGRYPMIMEQIAQQHDQYDANPTPSERYNPLLQSGKLVDLPRPGDQYMGAALYSAFKFWNNDSLTNTTGNRTSGNVVFDTINLMMGTYGLFDMLENSETHPLALLSALGKSMMDASVRNIFGGAGAEILGSLLKNYTIGSVSKLAGGLVTKIGMLGITIGFTLYYVLPLLPFIYFFFAFGGWVKSIFEAMVAIPLWALAHIKIDGNGLPGPWATNGYFLLFEIFLRPILIVFGFMASIIVFAALVSGLNSVYDVVVMNVSGYDMEAQVFEAAKYTDLGHLTINSLRGPVDHLFFTAIYAIIVYMIGVSCFKLIDRIPYAILRYMGSTVSTFQGKSGDPAAELMDKMGQSVKVTKSQLNVAIDQARGLASGATSDRDVLMQSGAFGGGGGPKKSP